MCTKPVTIYKKLPTGSVKETTVPCGKCEECRNKLRNEVAALACLEGSDKSSLSFFTLTYRQDMLPIAMSEEIDRKRQIIGFVRGKDLPSDLLDSYKDRCSVSTKLVDSFEVDYCPSLFSEDWKHHLKRFRRSLQYHNLSVPFSMLCFGEYGTRRHRPHMHALIFGFEQSQVNLFSDLWSKYYGNADCIIVPRFNSDGSDAFMKVSKYISKYISKGSALPSFVTKGYAVKPRRLSSIGFGVKDLDIERLRSFI